MPKIINPDFNPSDKSRIYHTINYGDFIVLNDGYYNRRDNSTHFKIKFLLTGFEKVVSRSRIRYGSIKDPYYPKIVGIGCIGQIDAPPDIYYLDYARWVNMIKRCYDINHKSYKDYGGLGVTVCKRWLCFEYYYEDMPKTINYDLHITYPDRYQLDKDYLQQNIPMNQRVYSLETCIWLDIRMNSMQRNLVTNPNKVNKYHGVYGHGGHWYPEIQHMGKRIRLGLFDDEIAAANAYNNYMRMYISQETPINDVPYMPPEEVIKYNRGAKEMCKIVE